MIKEIVAGIIDGTISGVTDVFKKKSTNGEIKFGELIIDNQRIKITPDENGNIIITRPIIAGENNEAKTNSIVFGRNNKVT